MIEEAPAAYYRPPSGKQFLNPDKHVVGNQVLAASVALRHREALQDDDRSILPGSACAKLSFLQEELS